MSVLGVFVAANATAQTMVPAGTLGPQVWTRAGSPYVVTGQVTLESLTVGPGTVVRVEPMDPVTGGDVYVFVTNALNVQASPEEPAVFEPNGPDPDAMWRGILADTASITGAVFHYAQSIRASSGTMIVRSSIFDGGADVLVSTGADMDVDRTLFLGSTAGIHTTGRSQVIVTNSVFRSRQPQTQVGAGLDLNGSATITNCTFDGLRWGFITTGSVVVTNSIFTNSQSIVQRANGLVTVSHSLIFGVDAEGVVVESSVDADPRYASANDLRLLAGSPAIDSGRSEGAPDHDFLGRPRPLGAGYDMGAYEHDPVSSGGMAGVGGLPGGAAGAMVGGTGGTGGNGGANSGGAGSPSDGGASADGGIAGDDQRGGTATTGGAGTGPSGGGADDGGENGAEGTERGERRKIATEGCGCRTRGSERSEWLLLLALSVLPWAARRAIRRAALSSPRARAARRTCET